MDAKPGPQPDAHSDPSDAYALPDRPVLDPDPIPNIVLHPGDRIYYSRWDNGAVEYRLLDRNGNTYAVLDGHGHPTHPGEFVVDAIRYVSNLGGRELLPVRPQPDPDFLRDRDVVAASNEFPGPVAVPVVVDGDTIDYTVPLPDPEPVQHAHTHYHLVPGDIITDYEHDHLHRHTGAEARYAAEPGHDSAPHGDHAHPEPAA